MGFVEWDEQNVSQKTEFKAFVFCVCDGTERSNLKNMCANGFRELGKGSTL